MNLEFLVTFRRQPGRRAQTSPVQNHQAPSRRHVQVQRLSSRLVSSLLIFLSFSEAVFVFFVGLSSAGVLFSLLSPSQQLHFRARLRFPERLLRQVRTLFPLISPQSSKNVDASQDDRFLLLSRLDLVHQSLLSRSRRRLFCSLFPRMYAYPSRVPPPPPPPLSRAVIPSKRARVSLSGGGSRRTKSSFSSSSKSSQRSSSRASRCSHFTSA